MIFNIFAAIELMLIAIPVGIAYFAAGALGFNPDYAGVSVGLLLLIPVDLIFRLATMGGSEEDGPAGCLNVIWPNGGGHLMFIPTWIIGLVGLPLVLIGALAT